MTEPPNTNLRRRALFILCYACSGAAALIYQVAWTRLFSLELGHSVAASSTVLAAFMGGLAAGAWLAGRVQIPAERCLRIYAGIEILIALAALLLPLLLRGIVPIFSWAYSNGSGGAGFAVVRVVLSATLLGIPAAAMGATFPIAASWFASRSGFAADAGLLYGANSAGAAAGAISAGFWLIPALGLRGATFIAVALNVAAAAGAMWLSRHDVGTAARPQPKKRERPSRSHTALHPRVAAAGAAMAGFLALVYEVVWTRLIALIIGPTTYAFAAMAASFILGIAFGSTAGARLARRTDRPGLWLAGAILVLSASAAIAASFAASELPLTFARISRDGVDFSSLLRYELLYISALLFPTSFASGAAFTLALATATADSPTASRDVARIYFANTIGAVAGALLAGFALVPALGLQSTFAWMARGGTLGAAVVAIMVVDRHKTRLLVLAPVSTAVLVLALLQTLPPWDRSLLASGPYKYGRYTSADDVTDSLRAGQLEYYREGAAGTVSVRRLAGSLAMAIDGKVDASNSGDMLTQRLLGVLPVVLHPNPQDLLVIGLGSGVTAASALASGNIRHADVVEISPEVVQASAWFARENAQVLQDPRVRLLVGDGRTHLLLGSQQYDVIVSEPSNPWMAGVAALFTREFFEAARKRLKPGGLLCQWAHTYEMAEADLKSIAATFGSVFPHGTMWIVGDGDLLFIGSTDEGFESQLAELPRRLVERSIGPLLKDVAIESTSAPFVMFSFFVGGSSAVVAYGRDALVQTDDRMALEFTAARSMYARIPNENAAALRTLGSSTPSPAVVPSTIEGGNADSWIARGRAALKANATAMARESYRRAVTFDSRSAEALRGLTLSSSSESQVKDEMALLRGLAAAEPDNPAVRIELSHVLASTGDMDGAVTAAVEATHLDPKSPLPMEQLASVFADAGDANRLAPLAEDLVARFPERAASRYFRAALLFLRGQPHEAAAEARRTLAIDPDHPEAQNLLGAACATTGNDECARTAFERAVQLSPRDATAYTNLGFYYLQKGETAASVSSFAEALALEPDSENARKGMRQARGL